MKIQLSINEAKYLCLKQLGIAAELKSRGGLHILQTQAEIEIYDSYTSVEASTVRCAEGTCSCNKEKLPLEDIHGYVCS